ncbi:MAG: DUF4392 domain-containing protein [Gammaproteobacteria bacterium]|nr:DUF4392 domain-containing protein [Gammaproteobacteria bacterium]
MSKDIQTKIARIEEICGHDVGRGIEPIALSAKGGLLKAACSIAEHPAPHVAILTGFYIPDAKPPAAETDGPVGSAHLAAGLLKAGIPVRIVTDTLCANAVKAAIQATGNPSGIHYDIVPVTADRSQDKAISSILRTWEKLSISHVISLERVGPAQDGFPYNSKGNNIDAYTAPLHFLFTKDKGRVTIGIGDGGNELGMGSVPRQLNHYIENGEKIACITPCDYLIVCGVSNWGGIALAAALSLLRPDWSKTLIEGLTLEQDRRILEATIKNGPSVDGVTGAQSFSVDNLPWKYHAGVLEKILKAINSRGNTPTD